MKKLKYLLLSVLFISCATASYLSIESEPEKAEVFLISKWDWEKKLGIVNNKRALKRYQINEGNTPVTTRTKSMKYVVVL